MRAFCLHLHDKELKLIQGKENDSHADEDSEEKTRFRSTLAPCQSPHLIRPRHHFEVARYQMSALYAG